MSRTFVRTTFEETIKSLTNLLVDFFDSYFLLFCVWFDCCNGNCEGSCGEVVVVVVERRWQYFVWASSVRKPIASHTHPQSKVYCTNNKNKDKNNNNKNNKMKKKGVGRSQSLKQHTNVSTLYTECIIFYLVVKEGNLITIALILS
jgi:hypothetical protein